jgi:hypothetical protein
MSTIAIFPTVVIPKSHFVKFDLMVELSTLYVGTMNYSAFIPLRITNKMQCYTIFFIAVNALHVSGCFSARHQELKLCSVQQKSSGLIFRKSHSGSDVMYSCHHNSSRFTFSIFLHSWPFSVSHSLQSITPCIN